jgi:hypothetical protein
MENGGDSYEKNVLLRELFPVQYQRIGNAKRSQSYVDDMSEIVIFGVARFVSFVSAGVKAVNIIENAESLFYELFVKAGHLHQTEKYISALFDIPSICQPCKLNRKS